MRPGRPLCARASNPPARSAPRIRRTIRRTPRRRSVCRHVSKCVATIDARSPMVVMSASGVRCRKWEYPTSRWSSRKRHCASYVRVFSIVLGSSTGSSIRIMSHDTRIISSSAPFQSSMWCRESLSSTSGKARVREAEPARIHAAKLELRRFPDRSPARVGRRHDIDPDDAGRVSAEVQRPGPAPASDVQDGGRPDSRDDLVEGRHLSDRRAAGPSVGGPATGSRS